jgi:hypothetical protein
VILSAPKYGNSWAFRRFLDVVFAPKIHRLPGHGPAVLLQHGLLCTSSSWLISGTNIACMSFTIIFVVVVDNAAFV